MSEQLNCPYLIYKTSKSCASCTGYRCTSQGREKKVDESQLETCRNINEYILCTRYLETLPVDILETIEHLEETISYKEDIPYFDLPDISTITSTEDVEPEPIPEPLPVPVPVVPCLGCGHPAIRESDCPYQGLPPVGMTSCLGIWCYGRNKNIRVDKTCVNWVECSVYAMSKYKGVPFYNAT